MKLELLISCMHQKDASIITRSNVDSDVVVINQCDIDKKENFNFFNRNGVSCKTIIISTTERGLSRSRNMAISNATGDICLICDDDETLVDGYNDIIINAFQKHPEASVITFALDYKNKKFPLKEKKVGYFRAMKTNSIQIAFRRDQILKKSIQFDVTMGSGTGNGGGEEVRFLFDCLKKGLKIRYIPEIIASVANNGSQWFQGFTDKYFLDRGWSNRRLLGLPLACCYALYFSMKNYSIYRSDNTFWNALRYQLKGSFEKRPINN